VGSYFKSDISLLLFRKSTRGAPKKREKLLSFLDTGPFLPTSVPYPHTEFTQTLFRYVAFS